MKNYTDPVTSVAQISASISILSTLPSKEKLAGVPSVCYCQERIVLLTIPKEKDLRVNKSISNGKISPQLTYPQYMDESSRKQCIFYIF